MKAWQRLKDRLEGRAPPGAERSSRWPEVRDEYLYAHSECAVCGSTRKLEVHHVVPFHLCPEPEDELDPENLITLCRKGRFKGLDCHLIFGHLGNFKGMNVGVRADAAAWREKLRR